MFYLTCLLIYRCWPVWLVFPTQVNASWPNTKRNRIPYIYIYIKPFGFVVILGECCGRSRLIGECSNNLAASHIEKRTIPKKKKKNSSSAAGCCCHCGGKQFTKPLKLVFLLSLWGTICRTIYLERTIAVPQFCKILMGQNSKAYILYMKSTN